MAGLQILHSTEGATVDIVFVHGLEGHHLQTWTKGSVLWPKDLLAADAHAPRSRIFTFGYDANVFHLWASPAVNSLDSYSDDLFAQLQNERVRTKTSTRPIIFVVHSMGGLVLANGLVDAASSVDKQALAKHIRRIAFLGTPHQGSDKAKWAETGRRFLSLFKKSNPEILKGLDEKSEKLASVGARFPSLLRQRAKTPASEIEIVCFYEGLSMRGPLGMIVTKNSACLSGYERTLLDADHSSMCKFQNEDDNNYKRVSGVLIRWMIELGQPLTSKKGAKHTHSSHAVFSGAHNTGFQLGQNTGNLSGFHFGGGATGSGTTRRGTTGSGSTGSRSTGSGSTGSGSTGNRRH